MGFDQLCNELVQVRHKDGRLSGPLKAAFAKGKFTVFDGSLDVAEGDCIDRPLPNGKEETYEIVGVRFQHAFHSIPAATEMTVQKQGAVAPVDKSRKVVNISIQNSHGFQVGDHNTQHIVDSFRQVIERLDELPGTPEEKAVAKRHLKAFLEHPLTSAIFGAAAGSLLGMLK